jgi:hypothetical protein
VAGCFYCCIRKEGSIGGLRIASPEKQKTLALGVYPDVSLTDARTRREDARKLLANGIDPSAVKQAQKAEQKTQPIELINPAFQLSLKGDSLTIKTKTTTLALTTDQTAAVRAFLMATPNEVTL